MDPVTAMRAAQGLEVSAIEYAACQFRRLELEAIAAATFEGMDAWVTPSTPLTPLPVESLQYPEEEKRALLSSRNNQPANAFGSPTGRVEGKGETVRIRVGGLGLLK